MKNIIFAITLITISIYCYGQSSDTEIYYKGEGVYILLIDANTNVVINKSPEGKNPRITYDTFFKNYLIIYTDENGNMAPAKFSYVNTTSEGIVRVKNNNMIHEVGDYISNKGLLIFTSEELIEGKYYGALVIEKLVRVNK